MLTCSWSEKCSGVRCDALAACEEEVMVAGVGKSSIINALKLQRAAADGAAARSSTLAAAVEADSASLSGLSQGLKVQN